MKLFGISIFPTKKFARLNKRYSLKTDDGKPFKLLKEEQCHEIIEVSNKASMVGGNVVDHLCKQIINMRRLCEQIVEEKNNTSSQNKIIKDIEQII
tara:strand:+ start:822 stop:1109 length:288 start_codon:yes stop_codon:yes gene_type:complete